jgi:hypothetical protein
MQNNSSFLFKGVNPILYYLNLNLSMLAVDVMTKFFSIIAPNPRVTVPAKYHRRTPIAV